MAVLPPPTTIAGPVSRGASPRLTLLEEQGRGDDPRGIVAGHPKPPALRGPGGEEDRAIALVLEVAEREVAAHRGVEPEVDAEPDDPGDLVLEHVAGQPIRRDPDGHHPAGDGHRLEHRDRVAEAGEVVRRRHAGRAAADDPDLLGPARGRRLDRRELAVLGGESLEGPDGDRLVEDAATADRLAWSGADPTADRREGVDLRRDRVGIVISPGADQPDVATGIRARRAGDLAGRLGGDRTSLLHRAPDLPRLRSVGGLPRQQVAPRRRMLALERLAGHTRHRQPGLSARDRGDAGGRSVPGAERARYRRSPRRGS